MTDLEIEYQGPKRGADRAVLLAHGAGADMHAANLTVFADALADAKIPSLRFNFPYRSAGRRAPDRPAALEAAIREAAKELARRAALTVDRLVLGGRSMGGRISSAVAAVDGARGLVLLGYPLHPPGKPEQLRTEHFPKLHMPVLFVSGTRDTFGTPAELQRAANKIKGTVRFHWIDSGDHGFKPLKSSGLTQSGVLAEAAEVVVDFVRSLSDPE
ncbi:MAG TPA: alpha/beta family hydrolase [Acidimicrobiia bacterium]|nr:alpha/beta family hydrolase [Acidimicrobiia bacterium]